MKRALLLLLAFLSIGLLLVSCYSAPASGYGTASGIKNRAFVSQDVTGANVVAAVYVVDAKTDLLNLGTLINGGATPGMMVVTPNRNETLVFSGNGTQNSDNLLTMISNASESDVGHVTLPGMTESFVVSPDSFTAYVAVPTAPVVGQSPGAIEVVNLVSNNISAEVAVPAVRYLSISHGGNRILAFSSTPDTTDPPCSLQVPCFLFVITPSDIGTQTNPVAPVPGFDHPVSAFFSNDDNTAYVVNCGAQCTGTQASVESLDLRTNTPITTVNIPAAEVATVVGTTMYLAGTPVPPSPCTGQQTQATKCGVLTVFDLTTFNVTGTNIIITDGYHDHMAMGANGQLFVGGNNCTEINQGGETRGCLSVYNAQTGAVVIPPAHGDVTGLQPIPNRSVVYLVQNGELQIYDTATDKLQPTQVDINGSAVDVKSVD